MSELFQNFGVGLCLLMSLMLFHSTSLAFRTSSPHVERKCWIDVLEIMIGAGAIYAVGICGKILWEIL